MWWGMMAQNRVKNQVKPKRKIMTIRARMGWVEEIYLGLIRYIVWVGEKYQRLYLYLFPCRKVCAFGNNAIKCWAKDPTVSMWCQRHGWRKSLIWFCGGAKNELESEGRSSCIGDHLCGLMQIIHHLDHQLLTQKKKKIILPFIPSLRGKFLPY